MSIWQRDAVLLSSLFKLPLNDPPPFEIFSSPADIAVRVPILAVAVGGVPVLRAYYGKRRAGNR
jgi:hypothetical protein